jgi:hypothetical protein
MPALLASETSNQDSTEEEACEKEARRRREAAKAELEATRAERLEVLRPHLELLERIKSLLPSDSPDRLAVDVLRYLVDITPVDRIQMAVLRAGWEIHRKPFVLAELRASTSA